MPLYDYRCASCGHVVEVRHGFDDAYTEPCPVCAGELKRVINPAPVIFKGSGFYVTDSRRQESAKHKSAKEEPAKPASGAEAAPTSPTPSNEASPAKASPSKESAA